MKKPLYKTVKVIYNAIDESYEIWYRNWFFWNFDSSYKFDKSDNKHPLYYRTKEQAEQMAINRAAAMLKSVEVFRGTSVK